MRRIHGTTMPTRSSTACAARTSSWRRRRDPVAARDLARRRHLRPAARSRRHRARRERSHRRRRSPPRARAARARTRCRVYATSHGQRLPRSLRISLGQQPTANSQPVGEPGMKLVFFVHSLRSDWNHGNAHFLRGVVTELLGRGHEVAVYEPANAWSVENLVAERGPDALDAYRRAYPMLDSIRYDLSTLNLDAVLDGADLVVVHEWNDHDLVRRISEHWRVNRGYRLLFHDTHHRAVTDSQSMASYDLRFYDGVL